MPKQITGMYELLDAIEAVIRASDPKKREALAKTIRAYQDDFSEDFFWAIGPQSPTLLNHLLTSIEIASDEPGETTKSRVIRLVDRKPEENA